MTEFQSARRPLRKHDNFAKKKKKNSIRSTNKPIIFREKGKIKKKKKKKDRILHIRISDILICYLFIVRWRDYKNF